MTDAPDDTVAGTAMCNDCSWKLTLRSDLADIGEVNRQVEAWFYEHRAAKHASEAA